MLLKPVKVAVKISHTSSHFPHVLFQKHVPEGEPVPFVFTQGHKYQVSGILKIQVLKMDVSKEKEGKQE